MLEVSLRSRDDENTKYKKTAVAKPLLFIFKIMFI
jgi:hypothetical protein